MPIEVINRGDVVLHRDGREGIASSAAESGQVAVETQSGLHTWSLADIVDVAPPHVKKASDEPPSKPDGLDT